MTDSQKPINPDSRALPDGWTQHFEPRQQIWYYVRIDITPPIVTFDHPADSVHSLTSLPRSSSVNTRTVGPRHSQIQSHQLDAHTSNRSGTSDLPSLKAERNLDTDCTSSPAYLEIENSALRENAETDPDDHPPPPYSPYGSTVSNSNSVSSGPESGTSQDFSDSGEALQQRRTSTFFPNEIPPIDIDAAPSIPSPPLISSRQTSIQELPLVDESITFKAPSSSKTLPDLPHQVVRHHQLFTAESNGYDHGSDWIAIPSRSPFCPQRRMANRRARSLAQSAVGEASNRPSSEFSNVMTIGSGSTTPRCPKENVSRCCPHSAPGSHILRGPESQAGSQICRPRRGCSQLVGPALRQRQVELLDLLKQVDAAQHLGSLHRELMRRKILSQLQILSAQQIWAQDFRVPLELDIVRPSPADQSTEKDLLLRLENLSLEIKEQGSAQGYPLTKKLAEQQAIFQALT